MQAAADQEKQAAVESAAREAQHQQLLMELAEAQQSQQQMQAEATAAQKLLQDAKDHNKKCDDDRKRLEEALASQKATHRGN